MMKKLVFLLLSVMVLTDAAAKDPGQVMLLGTFHFDNPGLDAVKSDVIDVSTAENQAYLKSFSQRVAGFEPQVVMLEFEPKDHESMNQKYQQYLAGDFELPINEMYQIGFRVAKAAGLKQVHGFDEREVGWQGAALFEHIKQNDPSLNAQLEEKIKWLTERTNHDMSHMSLADLLLQHNSEERDLMNKGFYLMTNAAGEGGNFVGADAAASWWHRNFRMYAKLQRQALGGKRVFAMAGQGHTAILKDLLKADENLLSVDVNAVISTQ